MNRLILGTALATVGMAAMSGQAWAQVQADAPPEKSCFLVFDEADPAWTESQLDCEAQSRLALNEEIIVTADRLDFVRADDLTVPASVLSETDIADRAQQYVSDLLRALPGVAVSQAGSGARLTQIRVRGSEANQVLVLIDGVEVANPSNGEYDFSGLSAADVVKVEFLRGEQSALYGSDAVSGVISIITRAGETTERFRAQLEAGSRDTAELQVSGVIPISTAALSLNGTVFRTDGFDVSGTGGAADGAYVESLNVGLNRVVLGGLRFDGKFGSSERRTEFDEDSDFNGRLDDTNSESTVRTDTWRGDARLSTGEVEHKLSVSHVSTDTDTRAGFATRTRGERSNANYVAGISTQRHSFTALGEIERETYRIVPNFTEAGAEPENDTAAVAGDYSYTGEALTLSASARYDVNDLFADRATWRVGAGYGLPWDGRIRASVGTGIKNPSLIELFGFFPGSNFTGNADLQPEESLGVSVGYEQDFGALSLSVDLFQSELTNEISTVFNPDFTSTVINLETDSDRRGIEIEADWKLNNVFDIYGSATFLDSEENGVTEIRRPDFTASVSAAWQASNALRLSAQVDHTGSQPDTDFATFSRVSLDSFTLVSGRVAYAVTDNVVLTLRGENLLDEDYQQILGYASAGRGVFGGLALDF